MNGLGGAAGVLLGGIITELLSWRWILLINPPIGLAVAIDGVGGRHRTPQGQGRPSFDLAGALTLTIGQMVLVYGVVEAGLAGWGVRCSSGPIAIGAGPARSLRPDRDPPGLRAARFPSRSSTKTLKTANSIVLLFSAALFPMWFVSSLYMQQVLGLSPLDAGLTFLPMTLTIMLVASRAGRLVSDFGVRPVLGGGLIMLAGGMLLFTRIGTERQRGRCTWSSPGFSQRPGSRCRSSPRRSPRPRARRRGRQASRQGSSTRRGRWEAASGSRS